MRIGVNLLTLSQDRFGGVEQYITNLMRHLTTNDRKIKLFLFLSKPNRDLFPDFQKHTKKIMIKDSSNLSFVHDAIENCQLDVWFSPLHRSYIPGIKVPAVVTIHDVLHTSYPQFVSGELELNNQYYQQFAPSFDAVITVSNFSKKAITQHLHIAKEKIHPLHPDAPIPFLNPPDENLKLKIKKKYNLPDIYAIYPASYNPHKNHLNLLKAVSLLRSCYNRRVHLVLTGYASKENEVYQFVLRFLKDHDLENQVHILGYVAPEDMPYLYLNAGLMVFPSLYEGFGIPLVEAMRTQCPIVCSNRGSIPEVAGDAALQFNPEHPEEIAKQIVRVMSSSEIRSDLIEKGRKRAALFSWEKCAEKTLDVFQSVIDSSNRRDRR